MLGEDVVLNISTRDGTIRMLQVFDGAFYLDSERMVHFEAANYPLEFPTAAYLSRIFSWAFCEDKPPGFRYSKAYYDPSLSILFAPPPDPSESVPIERRRRGTGISIVVLVCIGVVVLAVVGVILYHVFKPTADPLKGIRSGT